MTKGQRIASLRKQWPESQAQLAKSINVSPSTIAMWETDQRAIKDDDLVNLANHYGVTTDYILTGHDDTSIKKAQQPKHIDVEDIVDQQAMLTSRNHALSDEDRNAIRALLTTYLNSAEGQDRLRKFGGYDENGNKKDEH